MSFVQKDHFTIECRRGELGLSPHLSIESLTELATLHFVLKHRLKDGNLYLPQQVYIQMRQQEYPSGSENWLGDMLEMLKGSVKKDLQDMGVDAPSDDQIIAHYLKYAEKLQPAHEPPKFSLNQ